jgi:hypothetical protein
MILPLPLAPFEEYMLADDRPAYPMNFFIRLRFSGTFDRPALDSALQTALARHPLLSAVVQQTGRKRPQWIEANHCRPAIRRLPQPPHRAYPHAEGIDLRAEPGLRLSVVEGTQSADLLAQFHHACCDGLGALLFLGDLLVAYALATDTAAQGATLSLLEEERLRGRGRFGLTPRKLLAMAHRQLVGVLGVWQFFAHAPVPAAPYHTPPAAQPLPDSYPAACTVEFAEHELDGLRHSAAQTGVTLNDLLARDLFLALAAWKSRHFSPRDHQWLRLSVPINLRTPADRKLPAANAVSMVFLDRRPRDFADPVRLLVGIHRQMERIKRLRLGLTFVWSVTAVRALPGGLARMAAADQCSATCVLTNLGRPLASTPLPRQQGRIAVGGAVLEGIDMLAPLRPYTCAAFAVYRYAGRLCICLHYDPRPLKAAQAEDLLETFARQVRTSLGAKA